MSIVTLILVTCSEAAVGAAPEANPTVWKKELGEAGTLLVEQAFVYGPAFNHYQYTFILESGSGDSKDRRLLWIRRGYVSTISGQIPEPQLAMLDAEFPGNALCVIFNQHERCLAFLIEFGNPDRAGTPQPTHPDLNGPRDWFIGGISLGRNATSATILPAQGAAKARVQIKDAEGNQKLFHLLENDSEQWRWVSQTP